MEGEAQLQAVVATSNAVAASRSRTAKVTAIAALLREMPLRDAAAVAAYLSGVVPQGRLGVGWRSLQPVPPAVESTLTVHAVDAAFSELAQTSGAGSVARRTEIVGRLFGSATAAEQRFLAALIGGELRQGALDAVMLQALARAAGVTEDEVRRAAMLAGSVTEVVVPALTGGAAALAQFGLRVGTPVLPMLAGSAPDVGAAMADDGVRIVERKLDGIRVQAHRDGDRIRLFTRSLDDITHRLPEVVEQIAGLRCSSVVLDGEVLALRPDGRPQPFQVTGARTASHVDPGELVRRTPLTTWLFDVLHLDGEDLLDRPLTERRGRLTELLASAHPDLLVPGVVTDQAEVAEQFFRQSLAEGHEGVVVKDPDTSYAAGRRGRGWVKVKPRHTLDLVVLAVEWGSGRRRGWLSNIHLGARDPDSGGFVMVGKTFKGMTDEMLAWQTARFAELAIDPGFETLAGARSSADGSGSSAAEWGVVTVRPEQVVEIAIDGIQRSRRYPGGVALRFARVLRYRDDKTAAETDTIDTVRSLGA